MADTFEILPPIDVRSEYISWIANWAVSEAQIMDQEPNSYLSRLYRRAQRRERADFRADAQHFGVTVEDIVPRIPAVAKELFISQSLQYKRAKLAVTVLNRLLTVPKRSIVR